MIAPKVRPVNYEHDIQEETSTEWHLGNPKIAPVQIK